MKTLKILRYTFNETFMAIRFAGNFNRQMLLDRYICFATYLFHYDDNVPFFMIRVINCLSLWAMDFSNVEQKYKLDDMRYTWNVQRTAYGVNNHWLALHTLKNSCTGKLKSIKLTLHYQVKRFRSCVNLEGPFFVIGTSIHYVVSIFLFPSSQCNFTCNVALIK